MSAGSASADVLRLLAAVARLPTQRHAEFAAALELSGPASLDDWRTAHTASFIEQCPPHASVIVGARGHIGGEAADRVTDFRRMLGKRPESEAGDCLPDVLADYAELVAQAGADARARHARGAMLWEHLLPWVTLYLDSVARSASSPYDRWAVLTRDVLYLEADNSQVPQQLPLHLRAAPPAADFLNAESADHAIAMLLAPIECGVVLTRADLQRMSAKLRIEAVHGSRAATLKYLLEQNSSATLIRLAQAARDQCVARVAERERLGDVATFWSERAAATADALATMAGQLDKRSLDSCEQ